LKYWYHILSVKPPIVFEIYKLLLTDANNGKQWASNVKDLLCNLGFNDLWISQDPGNFSLEVIKLRIKDQYLQLWFSRLEECNKHDIFKRIILEFCIEKYLDFHITCNVQLLTKIRSGTLKLNVETGRYQNIVRENRTCISCNMNVLEDEYHFLLVYPAYRSFKSLYLPRYYCAWPKLYKLLKVYDKNLKIKYCRYLNSAGKLRLENIQLWPLLRYTLNE
jgi:hypothetical protein